MILLRIVETRLGTRSTPRIRSRSKTRVSKLTIIDLQRCRQRQRRDQASEDVVHALPDARTGERVPFQPVSDAAAPHRDRAQPLPVGAPDQNLVPEPAHEVEEGAQDRHDEHDAASSHDAPPPPPPAAPPPSDHGRLNRRP